MTVRVSGKSISVGEALRGRVSERTEEVLRKYFDGNYSGHITLSKDGFGFRTDCALHLDSGITLEAESNAADAYASAEPVIAAYARMCKLLGPAGSGQLTKMVNQICIAGLVEGLSEGIHFAKKAGLDVNAVVETISKGAAQSWQMDNRYKTMNEGKFDYGFAVEWMRKDLMICLAESRRNGASLPVTALVNEFYSEVEKMGGKRWDTSSLLARLER